MARKKKATEPEVSRDPIVNLWRGETRYACPFCPFDTLEQSVIGQHIALNHPVPKPEEESADATTNADQNDGAGAEPDGGRGGDDDGGGHDQ